MFLSNVCYFLPKAIWNENLFNRVMAFEIKMFLQTVFILDADLRIGRIRNADRKSLKWLKDTRKAYLDIVNSDLAKKIKMTIIQESLSIEEKIIENYIKEEMKIW